MKRFAMLGSVLVLATTSCEPALIESPTDSPLEANFAQAAHDYQVPVGLLKALAYVQSRVTTTPLESASGEFGMLQLSARPEWNVLHRGAALIGVDDDTAKHEANLVAGAAVLRALFDETQRTEPSLQATQAGDWYRAVALFPGFESATVAQEFAAQVFERLEQGFDTTASGVQLKPTASNWRQHAPAVIAHRDALGDYPGAAGFSQSPNYTAGRSSYDFIVIHTMQGSYSGTKSWFLNSASNVSAHYIVRSSDGQITQMVSDGDTAWHAQCYNARAIGIEHEGYIAAPSTWYTDAMYTESAKLTRYLADRHGIAIDRTHIIGHVDVASNCNTGGHTDPGTGWNWTKYMALVNNQGPATGTGVLLGVIYSGGDTTNREAGATVTVNGQTATTGADGTFQFTLAAGTYTASVTKAGFSSAQVSRTVVENAQVWGSMEINPTQASTGTLKGVVYAYNSKTPGDVSAVLAGASVVANGVTKQTDASGTYSFDLAPGTYSVSVSKSGYRSNQLSFSVKASSTTTGNVGLTVVTAPDTQPPTLAITSLKDGASLDLGVIDLKGTASDDSTSLTSVSLVLNSNPTQTLAVTAGAFATQVQLAPGANVLTVSATDAAGNVGQTQVHVTFNAGVAGIVYLSGDEKHVLPGATVQLRAGTTGALVSTVMTDSAGAFFAPVTAVPADYVLVVKLAGYLTASETVTAPADQKLRLKLPLSPGQDSTGAMQVVFAEPAAGATVTTDTVIVYGSAQGFELASVDVNGVAADLVGAGGFSASVPLKAGANTIEAVAQGIRGESVSATVTVFRSAANSKAIAAKSGCSTGLGLSWWYALALLPWWRRRR